MLHFFLLALQLSSYFVWSFHLLIFKMKFNQAKKKLYEFQNKNDTIFARWEVIMTYCTYAFFSLSLELKNELKLKNGCILCRKASKKAMDIVKLVISFCDHCVLLCNKMCKTYRIITILLVLDNLLFCFLFSNELFRCFFALAVCFL